VGTEEGWGWGGRGGGIRGRDKGGLGWKGCVDERLMVGV